MSELFEHGYAVVVDINADHLPELALPIVSKDGQAVYDVLVHPQRCAYPSANVRLLSGPDATRDNIMAALAWLQGRTEADPQATAMIYYTGHGAVHEDQYYLIPYDVNRETILDDALKAAAFNELIRATRARHMLVVFDCCHDPGMGSSEWASAPYPMSLAANLLENEGWAVLTSSSGEQKSRVRADQQMSIFTYHFIEALTGHAPHSDDASLVSVTDLMSWVTQEVKKSAARDGREQTPVMRISGVFPVAQLLGGQGLAKGLGASAPSPLAALPPVEHSVTFKQEGQTIRGTQVNISSSAQIGQIGDNINTGGGAYIRGDKIEGGDKVSVGSITGSTAAIGRESKASHQTHQEARPPDLQQLFSPLLAIVRRDNPALSSKVKELQAQAAAGSAADDVQLAGLIADIAAGAPSTKEILLELFQQPTVAASAAGPVTQFQLQRLSA